MEINLILFIGIIFITALIFYFIGRRIKAREIKIHRADAIARSRAVLSGQFSEQIAPFLPGFKYFPTECRFIGKPVDFIVFKGVEKREIEEVVFVEVKSGNSKLSSIERSLKLAIDEGRVSFEEYRVNKKITDENRDLE
ncbi:MAG: hypothetical protein IH845_04600 [Nanoarchaeota archaeon]|nr:hypothetical protein [Nanoarchaeota archaeon]